MAGDDSRAARILSDLCGVLRREKNILEFGFVYCPDPLYNKSPIVVLDGNLGIETWCSKLLYFHAYSQLFQNKHKHDLNQVRDCSLAVLLLNPDCTSAWNLRKELVVSKYLTAEDELKFCRLVLSKHPKSAESFIQRRWLLQHIFPASKSENAAHPFHQDASGDLGPAEWERDDENATLMGFVRAEMDACTLAASRYPSNYNAWSHRIWVIKHLARNSPELLRSELTSSKSWVCEHISDHSGFHYRQYLLGALSRLPDLTTAGPGWQDGGDCGVSPTDLSGTTLVLDELQLILELVTSYPGHEAIWYHRRYVAYLWKILLCSSIYAESKEGGECLQGVANTESSRIQPPSSNKESIKNCLVAEKLTGKRPSENQQIGNEPLGKRPSEDQPIGNQPFEECPIENSPDEDVRLNSGTDKSSQVHSANVSDSQMGAQGILLSAMHVSSQCCHDASSVYLSNHCLSHKSTLKNVHPNASLSALAEEKLSCSAKDAFSSSEIERLIQHEERFIKIVVESTRSLEKAAQKRCAESYRRWLENLHA